MATYTNRTVTSTRREWIVPTPAAYVEIYKAFAAAEEAFRLDQGMSEGSSLADNDLMVTVTDDAVVISYTVEKDASKPPTLGSVANTIAGVLAAEAGMERSVGETAEAIAVRLRTSMPGLGISSNEAAR